MNWFTQFLRAVAGVRDREHRGMDGLWLATHDLKAASNRLMRSREHLSRIRQRQANAVNDLENTVRAIKQHKHAPPPLPTEQKEQDNGKEQ